MGDQTSGPQKAVRNGELVVFHDDTFTTVIPFNADSDPWLDFGVGVVDLFSWVYIVSRVL